MKYLDYFKWTAIILGIGAIIWFAKDYQDKKEFKQNTESNERFNQKFDSLRIVYIKLTDKQMNEHLKTEGDYKELLKQNNIKMDRVTSVMKYLLKYRDTTIVKTDFSDVIQAINERTPYKQPFKDSTSCMVIKGLLEYTPNAIQSSEFGAQQNGSRTSPLTFSITEKTFNGETKAFGYWERNLWEIAFGIKTRFLGKKIMTAKVIDKCGQSQIINIEKAK